MPVVVFFVVVVSAPGHPFCSEEASFAIVIYWKRKILQINCYCSILRLVRVSDFVLLLVRLFFGIRIRSAPIPGRVQKWSFVRVSEVKNRNVQVLLEGRIVCMYWHFLDLSLLNLLKTSSLNLQLFEVGRNCEKSYI